MCTHVSQLREGAASILQQPHISGDIPRPAPVAGPAAPPADILPDIEVWRTNKFALLWGEAQLCLPYVCL